MKCIGHGEWFQFQVSCAVIYDTFLNGTIKGSLQTSDLKLEDTEARLVIMSDTVSAFPKTL